MLSDFELITHRFPDRNDITIYPISDVHLGAAEHMTREWELFCQRVVSEPNSYIILGGDLINNATRNSVSIKPFKVVNMTSWMTYGGYAAQKMLLPTSHAPQTITLCGKRKLMTVTM